MEGNRIVHVYLCTNRKTIRDSISNSAIVPVSIISFLSTFRSDMLRGRIWDLQGHR